MDDEDEVAWVIQDLIEEMIEQIGVEKNITLTDYYRSRLADTLRKWKDGPSV